jgi:hypothetical protein
MAIASCLVDTNILLRTARRSDPQHKLVDTAVAKLALEGTTLHQEPAADVGGVSGGLGGFGEKMRRQLIWSQPQDDVRDGAESRATPRSRAGRCARDPSLRLKDGYARDDANSSEPRMFSA